MKYMSHKKPKCFGTTTVGERGQVVIPADAREEMNLKAGDKLIVCGKGSSHPLILIKAESIAETITYLTEKVDFLNRLKKQAQEDE